MLVAKYHQSNCKDKEILVAIDKAIKASIVLQSKRALIEGFLQKINVTTDVMVDWKKFVEEQREEDLKNLIAEERLKEGETRKFVDNMFRDGFVKTTGLDIDNLMPAMSLFGGGGNREAKKQGIIAKIQAFFDKFFGIVE